MPAEAESYTYGPHHEIGQFSVMLKRGPFASRPFVYGIALSVPPALTLLPRLCI
jgi:hypothetical protein